MADLVSKLSDERQIIERFRLRCLSPDDGKYGDTSENLIEYLSPEAEWKECANLHKVLLETRMEFGEAEQWNVDEVKKALEKIDPLNMALMEKTSPEEGGTRHDQLAVIEEIGRYISLETKALLHPGTTSYDIIDTIRPYLFKKAWKEKIRPIIISDVEKLCDLGERSISLIQVGRTHLQDTSPVTFGGVLASYAARIAKRVERLDLYFNDLKGKISGIVGTGAGIEMVIGKGKAMEFEKAVLKKLGLKPDYTSTQIVQKEGLSDVGHGFVSLMHVHADFADDIRKMYSSSIKEVTSRSNSARLGGSSSDAGKDNPIDLENIGGTEPIVESGMRLLYFMIQSDFQRDLKNSKPASYQPQLMMAEVYETFVRLNKILPDLSVNEDRLAQNLLYVRNSPSDAMGNILKGEKFLHPVHGDPHTFVKEVGKKSKKSGRKLLDVALEDIEFARAYENLSEDKRAILGGKLELYIGDAIKRAEMNIDYAKSVN